MEESTYSRLAYVRDELAGLKGTKESFGNTIEYLIRKSKFLIGMDPLLRQSLGEVSGELSSNPEVLGVILFGSVVTGTFSEQSDIDLFVVVSEKTTTVFEFVEETVRKVEDRYFALLRSKHLPVHISPMLCSKSELGIFRPIFFDIADFGVILYERPPTISDFLSQYMAIPHTRTYVAGGEKLTWQF